jgi:hypothetical protein
LRFFNKFYSLNHKYERDYGTKENKEEMGRGEGEEGSRDKHTTMNSNAQGYTTEKNFPIFIPVIHY